MKRKIFLIITLLLVSCSSLVAQGFVNNNYLETNSIISEAATTRSENRTIQTKLKRWGYYKGNIDGIYGSQTKKAVRYFQRKNGLAVDGIVGRRTAAAMGIRLSSNSSSNSQSSSDLDLLAKIIHAEARGEPYSGQVAIAAVVLNRVKSASFPNTIAGVIYQPYAFTAVDDGQINLRPNKTAYKAAQDALNGWDPTYGCLYYYNPKTATSSWIWSRKTVVTIGRHRFAI